MKENKLKTIVELFEGKEIRSIWDSEKEEYYFSVIDIIVALTHSERPRKYWNDLKKKLNNEGSELSEKIGQLKMQSTDGKYYNTDVLDMKGILRLIESVPSPKAEPFKLWLANLGKEEIDNAFDPSKGMNKMIDYYLMKGYTLEWIELRIRAIINRKKLTKIWNDNGVKKNTEYAILTNEIYQSWSGMKASEYKAFKNIRKESLRDNMTDIEVALTDLGELVTRDIAKEEHPQGLKENLNVAKRGGGVAKGARDLYEKETKKSAISKGNVLNYQYINESQKEKLQKSTNKK